MKTSTQIGLVLLALFTGLSSSKAQMNLVYADTLNKVFNQTRIDQGMKGSAGAVVFSDGSVWSAASGHHGDEELSTDFVYDIGSNTKTMISAIILMLDEEGALSIDDTLYSYISPVEHVPFGLTLEQLLNHQSGVYNFTEHNDFFDAMFDDESKFWHPDSLLANFMDVPHFDAGDGFYYSNTNYFLLGQVIEAIEQKPLKDVLYDRIFAPQGLENSFLDQYDNYSQTKTGSWMTDGEYKDNDFASLMSAAWAAGGVVSTPEDLAMYAHTLYRGDLLSETAFDKMKTGITLNSGRYFGLGFIKTKYNDRTYYGHGGNTLQNCEMEYSVESDFSLVVMNIDFMAYDETEVLKETMIDLLEYIEDTYVPVVASTGEVSSESIQVNAYPNPSNGQMVLNMEAKDNATPTHVEVRDLSGRIVHQQHVANGTAQLQKFDFGAGLYFANIYNGQTLIGSKKIVFN